MKVRVTFEDSSQRVFEIADGWGCNVSVANDAAGSLSIGQQRQEINKIMNRIEVESRMLAMIRKNEANAAWREVELVDVKEPQIIELGESRLAAN